MEIKKLLSISEDSCKGERYTVTGKYPCSSQKENVGSKGEAVLALKCWRSLGTMKPWAFVRALNHFSILQGSFSCCGDSSFCLEAKMGLLLFLLGAVNTAEPSL